VNVSLSGKCEILGVSVRLVAAQRGPCLIEGMILFTVSYVASVSALDNPLAATA